MKYILIGLIATLVITAQVRSFLAHEKARNKEIAELTARYTEVYASLRKADVKIDNSFRMIAGLRKKLAESSLSRSTFSLPKILWVYSEFKLEG